MTFYEIYRTPRMKLKALKLGWCWQGFFYNCIWAFSNNLWSLGFTLLIILFGGRNGFFNLPLLTRDGHIPLSSLSIMFSLVSVSFIFLILLKQGNCFRFFYYHTKNYQLIDCVDAANEKEAIKVYQAKQFEFNGKKSFYEPVIFNVNYTLLKFFFIGLFIFTVLTTGKEIYTTLSLAQIAKWLSYNLILKLLSIGLLLSYIYQLHKKEWSVIPSILLYLIGLFNYICTYTLFFYSEKVFIPFVKSPLGVITIIVTLLSLIIFALVLYKLTSRQKSIFELYRLSTMVKSLVSKIKFIILGRK